MNASAEELIILGFGAVIMAPIFEEILFRKITFSLFVKIINFTGSNYQFNNKQFLRNIAIFTATILTSIFFMILHLDSLTAMPGIFIIGVAAQLSYIHFKSLYPAIALHTANNFVSMIMALLQ